MSSDDDEAPKNIFHADKDDFDNMATQAYNPSEKYNDVSTQDYIDVNAATQAYVDVNAATQAYTDDLNTQAYIDNAATQAYLQDDIEHDDMETQAQVDSSTHVKS